MNITNLNLINSIMSIKIKPVTFRKKAFLPNTNLFVANPQPPKVLPYHNHEFGELVFILSGSVIHITEDGESTLERGDVFVIEGEQKHGFKSLKELQVFYVLFDLDYFNTLRTEFEGLKSFNIIFGLEPQLRKNYNFKSMLKLNDKELDEITLLLRLYENECRFNLPWKINATENFFKNIVIQLCRYYSKSNHAKNDVLFKIEKAINYMKLHFAKDLKLEKLANTAKMNPSTFRRIFKEATGYSPVIFLQQLRIAEAARILTTEKVKVKHAGKKVGYNNQSYFVKIFKSEIGITPREYLLSTRSSSNNNVKRHGK